MVLLLEHWRVIKCGGITVTTRIPYCDVFLNLVSSNLFQDCAFNLWAFHLTLRTSQTQFPEDLNSQMATELFAYKLYQSKKLLLVNWWEMHRVEFGSWISIEILRPDSCNVFVLGTVLCYPTKSSARLTGYIYPAKWNHRLHTVPGRLIAADENQWRGIFDGERYSLGPTEVNIKFLQVRPECQVTWLQYSAVNPIPDGAVISGYLATGAGSDVYMMLVLQGVGHFGYSGHRTCLCFCWWDNFYHNEKYDCDVVKFIDSLDTFSPRQHGRHFTNDIIKCIFLNENVCMSPKAAEDDITLKSNRVQLSRSSDS